MLQPIRSLCVLVCVSSLFLVSEAQFFEESAASFAKAPVGFISRVGTFGDQESYVSFGNAPVGVYQRQEYPLQSWYHVPRILPIKVYPPVKPPVQPPPKPVVRPPVKPPCHLPGPCVAKPVRPVVRPPPKPVVRPPVKPPCHLPGPCVAKPVRPVVLPPSRPRRPTVKPIPKVTKRPRPRPKPEDVRGRNVGLGGIVGSILRPVLGG